MKQWLTSSFLLLVTTSLLGQVEIPEYDFSKVKEVDSIAAYITSDSDSWKEVFYYKDDKITKANYFEERDLLFYRLFHYDDKKQLSFESYYAKSSMFDSDKDDWIESWDPNYCFLTIERYSGINLIEEKHGSVNSSDTTVNQITTYTYDTKQRILTEVTRDIFVGFVGSYKANSADLKEFGEKGEVMVYSRTFVYKLGKVDIFYKVNGTLTGTEIVLLDSKGQVTSIKQYSDKNILLSETTASYNEEGRLKSKTWKTHSAISVWGQEGDVRSDGTETIEYDNLGRPSTKMTVYRGGHETKTEYRYY